MGAAPVYATNDTNSVASKREARKTSLHLEQEARKIALPLSSEKQGKQHGHGTSLQGCLRQGVRPFEERRTGKGSAKRERIEGGREEKGCSKRSRGGGRRNISKRSISGKRCVRISGTS